MPTRRELLHDKLTYIDPDGACNGRLARDEMGRSGESGGERIGLVGPVPLPMRIAGAATEFEWYVFARVAAGETMPEGQLANSVLVYGDPKAVEAPLVRLHSGCQTGDVFSSMRCDCGAQFEEALSEIISDGAGVAIYLTKHEGRGIGLWAKALAYLLQDGGFDTYEANRELGYPDDARSYEDAAAVLGQLLGNRRVRLLSNNPRKRTALETCDFEVVEMRTLVAGHTKVNQRYIEAKVKNGHILSGWSSPD